jgi:hypothetical protein
VPRVHTTINENGVKAESFKWHLYERDMYMTHVKMTFVYTTQLHERQYIMKVHKHH